VRHIILVFDWKTREIVLHGDGQWLVDYYPAVYSRWAKRYLHEAVSRSVLLLMAAHLENELAHACDMQIIVDVQEDNKPCRCD
jgi:hypothetical protein